MYLIDPIPILPANIIDSGSIGEPFAHGKDGPETEWSAATWAVGQECIRASQRRVYKCAVARAAADTTPPELDAGKWLEMRPTARYVPFGPYTNRADQLVFKRLAVSSTTTDLVWRLSLRYADAVALFGLAGARVRVQVFKTVGGVQDGPDRVYSLLRGSAGQYDRRFGLRSYRDRLLIRDLPRHVAGELRITVEGAAGQLRRVSHITAGKFRYLPGVDFGGVEYGLTNTVRTQSFRTTDPDGTDTRLIYGTTQDMQGSVILSADRERYLLPLLHRLAGRAVAWLPSLPDKYAHRLTLGSLDIVPVKANAFTLSSLDMTISGYPVEIPFETS